jgi:hypothetical protein
MSTTAIAAPSAGLTRSRRIVLGFALFSIAGTGVVTLAPAIAAQQGSGGQPSFEVIAATGAALILLAGLFLGYVGRVLGLGRAWLLLALLSNGALLAYRFVVVPISFYSTTFTLGPYFSLDPNYPGAYGLIALLGLAALSLVVFMTYTVIRLLALDVSAPRPAAPASGHRLRLRNLLVALAITAVIVLALPFLGAGALYSLGMEVPTVARVAGPCLAGLALAWLLGNAGALHTASARAHEVRDVTVVTTFLWVALALLLIVHILWVIYMGVLVHLLPFRTVTQGK